MRPRGMPSKWAKVLPWYYTERRQPTRQAEFQRVLIEQEERPPAFFDEHDLAAIDMFEDEDA